MNKAISGVMLTLLILSSMLAFAFNIQLVKADYVWKETIYIRADGSITPSDAPLFTADKVTYVLTDNIVDAAPYTGDTAVIIERDNIVFNGNGYTIQGKNKDHTCYGMDLTGRSNVTIKNLNIKSFDYCLRLEFSLGNTLYENNIADNYYGVYLVSSSQNILAGNTISRNRNCGVYLDVSSSNTLLRNNILNNLYDIELSSSVSNTIFGNNITDSSMAGILLGGSSRYNMIFENYISNNGYGIWISGTEDNIFYHNNFVNNGMQVYFSYTWPTNIWDNGYPSGGNFWSDYTGVDEKSGPYQNETGSDGIGDTPYIINANNRDQYPLMNPPTMPSKRDQWPMFRHDKQRTGRSEFNGPHTPQVKWTFDTGGNVFSPIIGSDGTIYVHSGGNSKNLYAISRDGSLKWSFHVESSYSAPAVGPDGTIYFGSYDKKFYALNPNGTLKWYFQTGGYIYSCPAIDSDGTIYFGSYDGYLYALNPDSTLKWAYYAGRQIDTSPAISSDGTIYVFSTGFSINDPAILYAVTSNGTLKWTYKAPMGVIACSCPAIGSDGTIYFGCFDGKLYALNPDGSLKWNYQAQDDIVSSPAIGPDGTIYFGSYDKRFYALNTDGSLKWWRWTEGPIYSSAAVGADDTVYFGSSDGYIYAFNPDSTLKWSYQTGYAIGSSPAIGSDGSLFIGAGPILYAFGTGSDFLIKASPTLLTIQQGSSAESTITVTSINGFSQPVQLSVSGAPSGVTAILNPVQVTPPSDGSTTSILTVSVDATVNVGTYTLTVIGTNGTLTHSVDIFLHVVALPKFVLVPSEGWQRLELFVPTWRRSAEYPGKVVFEIFNKRDMWYIIKVYKRMPDNTWQEVIPDEFLSLTGPYLGPYSVKTFVFPYVLEEGDEIKIEVWNDLNDNALRALWALDFSVRALLGISISPQITNWPEIKTKLLTFYNGYLEAIGNLCLGKWKLGLLQLCKALVGSAASREFAEIINLLGVQTTAATIARIAFKVITSAFWLIPNVPLWWPLFENMNREPFMEDVIFTVKGTGTELPNLKVIEGLTIVQSEPYYVGETIDAQFTLRSEDESPVTLHVLMVGGLGPRGEIQDFTFKTNITINPGQSYMYEGKMQLISNGTYHFFIAYQTPEGEWVTNVPTDADAVNSLDINVQIPEVLIGAELCSPGELRIYDSQGRVTGLLNGEELMEIPNSFYHDGIVVIYYPNDSYRFQVKGVSEGEYNITLGRFFYENLTTFEATRIPISNNSLHQFTCDWDTLSINEEGVLIYVDSDGDNFFEKTFPSDSELTAKEFMFPAKATFTFNALWEGANYPITMYSSNSSITNFNFNQSEKQITFQLSGEADESGYCNVSIPKTLLKGEPWIVKLNGTNWNYTATENETHSFIYITYTFGSAFEVAIQGTWVVPEFSSTIILTLCMLTILVITILIRKNKIPKILRQKIIHL
ncbi:MAG: PQQ-binding-like beta-propeller repeat protein [Candidatus Bathyarchaeia archaeon]